MEFIGVHKSSLESEVEVKIFKVLAASKLSLQRPYKSIGVRVRQ
jgi:hypothetical protein